MDLKQLEYIVAIADCGSISKAADKLFISQSGLNQQLVKLENELGLRLFERSYHRLRITRAGEIYVNHAAEILRIKRNTYALLSDLKENISGEIELGITHEHGINIFTSVYPEFNQRYPHIQFHLQEHIVSDQLHLVSEGELDFGIVLLKRAVSEPLCLQPLYREDLLLCVPKSHRLAGLATPLGTSLTVMDLAEFREDTFSLIFSNSTMRKDILDPCFHAAGFSPKILVETAMNHALVQLVANGLCCAVLPHSRALASSYRDSCAWFRIKGNPVWNVSFAYRKNMSFSNSHRYFITLAQRYGRQMEEKFQLESPGYTDTPE